MSCLSVLFSPNQRVSFWIISLNSTKLSILSFIDESFSYLKCLILSPTGERYVVGIGEVEPTDGLRREVLHQLSINSMAHSELVKNLPENVSWLFPWHLCSIAVWLTRQTCPGNIQVIEDASVLFMISVLKLYCFHFMIIETVYDVHALNLFHFFLLPPLSVLVLSWNWCGGSHPITCQLQVSKRLL